MDEGLRSLLWKVFFILPIILLLGAWVFGSRIDGKIFSDKYLKETFYSFRLPIIFYFGGIFVIYIFFQLFDL